MNTSLNKNIEDTLLQLKKTMEHYYGMDSEIIDLNLYSKNHVMMSVIVPPHEGTKNRWMLRLSTVSAFDRWANSCAIEKFFDKDTDLQMYLKESTEHILFELLEYISGEYDELEIICDSQMNEMIER